MFTGALRRMTEPGSARRPGRLIGGRFGAAVGLLLGLLGGAAPGDIVLWGVVPGAVVGFVGGWLLDLCGQLL